MKKIEALKTEQLENKDVYSDVSNKVKEALLYNTLEGDEQYKLNIIILRLKESLRLYGSQLGKDLYEKYLDLIVKVDFLNIPTLGEKIIIDLFKKHFLKILKVSIDQEISMNDKLRSKVFGIADTSKRDPFLIEIKDALKENIENLGSESIEIDGKSSKPTVRNWIRDYDNMVGAGEHGELDISNYLFKSKNTKVLKSEDKKILKEILRLYEKLKLNMTHPNGIATYSLSSFGIRAVGSGLDKKYLPINPEEYRKEIEKRKEARAEKKQIVRGEKIPERNLIGKKDNDRQVGYSISEEPIEKESALSIKKKEKFSKLTSISKSSIAKLITPQTLAKLTVEDFRSYGSDAVSSGAFMTNKIKKLVEASPESRESVKHYLRKSELYSVYLSQGKESLESKKDITEIANNRKNKGEKYLEKEEFEVLKSVLKTI